MTLDVDRSDAADSIEGIQDHYLDAQVRAARARDAIQDMVETRRKQADTIVTTIGSLEARLRESETARFQLQEDHRHALERIGELERSYRLLGQNYGKLRDVFEGIMHDVEAAAPSTVAMDKRISAMLIHNEMAHDGQPQHAPVRRVADFHHSLFPSAQPLRQAAPPQYHDPRTDYRPAAYHPQHESAYAQAPDSHQHPTYRNER